MGLIGYLMDEFSARLLRAKNLLLGDAGTITNTLILPGGATLTAAGVLNLGSSLVLTGGCTLTSGGNITAANQTLSGVASVGALVDNGSASIGGVLTVGGNLTVTGGGTLTTAGVLAIPSNLTAGGSATITGLLTVNGTGSSTVAGSLTITKNLVVSGSASTFLGGSAANGNVVIKSNGPDNGSANVAFLEYSGNTSALYRVASNGNVYINEVGVTDGGYTSVFSKHSADDVVDVFTATLDRGAGNGGVGLGLGYLFRLEQGAGSRTDAGRFKFTWLDPSAAAEWSSFTAQIKKAGTLVDGLIVSGTQSTVLGNIVVSGTGNSTINSGGTLTTGTLVIGRATSIRGTATLSGVINPGTLSVGLNFVDGLCVGAS